MAGHPFVCLRMTNGGLTGDMFQKNHRWPEAIKKGRIRGMELRLLRTDAERDRFRACMREARASRGGKFRETDRSRVSDIQLAFARLYAVVDEANPDQLLAGFSIHCLNEFSQSFPIPNLSHLPPSGVYEAGQLWAGSHETAQALRKGAMILLGLLQAQAFLIYPLIIPRDVSTLYRVFKRVGPPFELPFAETLTGDKVYMQAMMLEGDDLRQQTELASRDGFDTRAQHGVIRFDVPHLNAERSLVNSPQVTRPSAGSDLLSRQRFDNSRQKLRGVVRSAENMDLDLSSISGDADPSAGAESGPREKLLSSRWPWCEHSGDARCPDRPVCGLQCVDKVSSIRGVVSDDDDI
jgi:hypothetical protein